VLDAEIVAVDPSRDALLPFQVLSSRPRKNVNLEDTKKLAQVCVFVFDLMMIDGDSLLELPLRARLERLRSSFVEIKGRFCFAQSQAFVEPIKVETVTQWLHAAIDSKCEGIMLKSLDGAFSTYEPSVRSEGWLKLKKDYETGLVETLDLVPIGAWWGNGRKAGWFSPFLLACYNQDTEQYETVCKCMTGFTDKLYAELTEMFQQQALPQKPPYYSVDESLRPDFWFPPTQVWEIRGADMTLSPVHSAAAGQVMADSSRGVSLRFPRFLHKRLDKSVSNATTSGELAEMYRLQFKTRDSATGNGSGLEEADMDEEADEC
jgi:DNA ligase-1